MKPGELEETFKGILFLDILFSIWMPIYAWV